jgi:hypothetical protein
LEASLVQLIPSILRFVALRWPAIPALRTVSHP